MQNLLNKKITDVLPHRDPFLFIDTVISVEQGKVTASRFIKKSEPFFKGHFPGKPLVPGVLLIESMAQTSGIACEVYENTTLKLSSNDASIYFLSRVSDIKFKFPVLPDSTIICTAEVTQYFTPFFRVQVCTTVNNKVVAEGELILSKQTGGSI